MLQLHASETSYHNIVEFLIHNRKLDPAIEYIIVIFLQQNVHSTSCYKLKIIKKKEKRKKKVKSKIVRDVTEEEVIYSYTITIAHIMKWKNIIMKIHTTKK